MRRARRGLPPEPSSRSEEVKEEKEVVEGSVLLDDDEHVEMLHGSEDAEDSEYSDVDINEGFEIDSLLTRRPQGRPKGVLDYKVPVNAVEGEYKKSEIVAALTHLYYMQDRQFAPDNVSLHHFQKLLNVSRHTVYRCLDDVKNGKILALKLHAELMVMSENLHQAERNRRRRQSAKMYESQARIMERRKFERRLRRASLDGSETPPANGATKVAPKRRETALAE